MQFLLAGFSSIFIIKHQSWYTNIIFHPNSYTRARVSARRKYQVHFFLAVRALVRAGVLGAVLQCDRFDLPQRSGTIFV